MSLREKTKKQTRKTKVHSNTMLHVNGGKRYNRRNPSGETASTKTNTLGLKSLQGEHTKKLRTEEKNSLRWKIK